MVIISSPASPLMVGRPATALSFALALVFALLCLALALLAFALVLGLAGLATRQLGHLARGLVEIHGNAVIWLVITLSCSSCQDLLGRKLSKLEPLQPCRCSRVKDP